MQKIVQNFKYAGLPCVIAMNGKHFYGASFTRGWYNNSRKYRENFGRVNGNFVTVESIKNLIFLIEIAAKKKKKIFFQKGHLKIKLYLYIVINSGNEST